MGCIYSGQKSLLPILLHIQEFHMTFDQFWQCCEQEVYLFFLGDHEGLLQEVILGGYNIRHVHYISCFDCFM